MRKALVFSAFVLFVSALAIAVHQYLPLERIIENEQRLRMLIQAHPMPAWLIGLCIYFAFSLVPGTTGKAMIAGWLFGLWPGILMVDLALTAAALVTFLVSRTVFQEAVQRRFRASIERIDRELVRDGAMYLLLLRLVHAPYTFMNYACGATRVRLTQFSWTTAVGLLPGCFVLVFVGTRLPTLTELLEKGPLQLLDRWLLGGLALTALLPIVIRWGLARIGRRPTEQIDATSSSELPNGTP
jgi:uncharacterized membrane protein YdjX (TVP38/TMEM64 family)